MSKAATASGEYYVVVDVESAGPNPSSYALLSIGACTVEVPHKTFYVELQPDSTEYTEEALQVNQLSLELLSQQGLPPAEALRRFESWLSEIVPPGWEAIFVAFNAPYDWMFINDYFQRYLGYNPFGHKALDMKAFFMGLHGVRWRETAHDLITDHYSGKYSLPHHALEDAILEAELFAAMLAESQQIHSSGGR